MPGKRGTLRERFWSKVDKRGPDECWPWLGTRLPRGYGRILIRDGYVTTAHRASYELTGRKIPDGQFVLHFCDNPSCVNPAHLYPGTHKQNMKEMRERGRSNVGSKNSNAKFTEEDILTMRILRKRNCTNKEIALIYDTDEHYVSRLITGKHWSHI